MKLLCLDFDMTMVNEHFHAWLSFKKFRPRISAPGIQIEKDGSFINMLNDAPSTGQGAPTDMVQTLLENSLTGPKNGEQMRDVIRFALTHDDKVAITSFTLYPEVIKPMLRAIGLTEDEIKQIYIIGGFPSDNRPDDTPFGKEEHIAEAMRYFGITNRADVILVDDSQRNLNVALTKGALPEGLVPVPKTKNPPPFYFEMIYRFLRGEIAPVPKSQNTLEIDTQNKALLGKEVSDQAIARLPTLTFSAWSQEGCKKAAQEDNSHLKRGPKENPRQPINSLSYPS